jgi:hypothetical protein
VALWISTFGSGDRVMTDREALTAAHAAHEADCYAAAGLPDVSAAIAEEPDATAGVWDRGPWESLPGVVEARRLYAEWAGAM